MDGGERSGAIALSYKSQQIGALGARAADILDLTARRSLSPLRASKEFRRSIVRRLRTADMREYVSRRFCINFKSKFYMDQI